jgi:hypothetical protein
MLHHDALFSPFLSLLPSLPVPPSLVENEGEETIADGMVRGCRRASRRASAHRQVGKKTKGKGTHKLCGQKASLSEGAQSQREGGKDGREGAAEQKQTF